MKLFDAEDLLDDVAYRLDDGDEIIPKDIKKFYREGIECNLLDAEVKIAIVKKRGNRFEIVKVLE